MRCDVIDGFLLSGLRQPMLFNFLDKPKGYKMFLKPETNQYKKINKSVWNNMIFYSEDDNHGEVDFNQESLTFALQLLKNCTIKWAFKNLKWILIVLVVDIDLLQPKHMVI